MNKIDYVENPDVAGCLFVLGARLDTSSVPTDCPLFSVYDLKKQLEEIFAPVDYSPSPGAFYNLVRGMLKINLVVSHPPPADPRETKKKELLQLTAAGLSLYKENVSLISSPGLIKFNHLFLKRLILIALEGKNAKTSAIAERIKINHYANSGESQSSGNISDSQSLGAQILFAEKVAIDHILASPEWHNISVR